ncbi:CDGSH iron-sulfur domain-containing protein [Citricoccus sp. GCM10030269]|uniref:CDGSH iron-sulfur domain-containing protein n=1 Tax=Citricoccus sp. GCM10030269 TaxID=3273388 RepID=UPI003623E67E
MDEMTEKVPPADVLWAEVVGVAVDEASEADPPQDARQDGEVVQITVCPAGPLLVRGPVEILDGDGEPVEQRRRTVALCRCGSSGIKPFCDGTHKRIGFEKSKRGRSSS